MVTNYTNVVTSYTNLIQKYSIETFSLERNYIRQYINIDSNASIIEMFISSSSEVGRLDQRVQN